MAHRARNYQLSANFNEREFACPCCGMVEVDPLLVAKLQSMRDKIGEPITVNSGYRCARHNVAVGGALRSYHLSGAAADISCQHWYYLYGLAKCLDVGGIGFYPQQRFCHVDVRADRAEW